MLCRVALLNMWRHPEYGLNEYDFAARQYVPAQMRFSTSDPKAEERPGLSPYIFCNSNPVMLMSQHGLTLFVKGIASFHFFTLHYYLII